MGKLAPKKWGGSSKFPGGHKVFHRTAQTAFVRVVIPRHFTLESCSVFKEITGVYERI